MSPSIEFQGLAVSKRSSNCPSVGLRVFQSFTIFSPGHGERWLLALDCPKSFLSFLTEVPDYALRTRTRRGVYKPHRNRSELHRQHHPSSSFFFFSLQCVYLQLFSLLALYAVAAIAWPSQQPSARAASSSMAKPVRITVPPDSTDRMTKIIPDAAHPFMAPGPKDQRGPCPGMNTLANHGYIPRDGIATFEDILNAMVEVFNIRQDFGAFLVAANMLMKGNPYLNKISIGGVSSKVPAVPGSKTPPGGLSEHGGFEGDASLTREDVNLGDNANFQNLHYDNMLIQLGKFGGDGTFGNSTVFNAETLAAVREHNFRSSMANNPKFAISPTRFIAIWTESSFLLDMFANGTTSEASLPVIGSFLRNQTFPENWFRPATERTGGEHADAIREGVTARGLTVLAGHTENGEYILEKPAPAPFNASFECEMYYNILSNSPASYANATGVFGENVKLLSSMVQESLASGEACDVPLLPLGMNK
ncbi:Cloroperoxidase [Mycena kentingensis (nom. inval.)]|nr:Cloroperoxidase [Mycena kentingensis (nom. inval.)]